eukprot:2468099-Prymnesium_polylepis.1
MRAYCAWHPHGARARMHWYDRMIACLQTHAQLHGIGSLWIADTELHEASDVQPAQAALKRMPALSSFGSSGGIGRFNKTGLGIFAESDDE